jgi:hypothetical protein
LRKPSNPPFAPRKVQITGATDKQTIEAQTAPAANRAARATGTLDWSVNVKSSPW